MVLNIELLDGAVMEYLGVFYVATVENSTLVIKELFTGIRAASSDLEVKVLRAFFEAIQNQTTMPQ